MGVKSTNTPFFIPSLFTALRMKLTVFRSSDVSPINDFENVRHVLDDPEAFILLYLEN
ncbi:MAG: hypothetical protein RL333_1998, partial [Pseudomonadota bacterium]